ncbi:MAG TPA: hypothetical protein DCM68_07870 [Verrucomicrobia bacterium]|nr:hypothetical protein [Verrucomicrobiota bacterium]
MNIDKPKLVALKNAVAISKGEKIPEGVQRVRDLARAKRDLQKRANLEDRLVKVVGAKTLAGVDAGFRQRDKKTRPPKDGQGYDADNWKDAFDKFEALLEAKRKPNGKLPRGAIGLAFKKARQVRCMFKVTENRFRRKYYADRGRPR